MKEKNEPTFWNGEHCMARRVRVVVGKADKPTFWYAGLEGTVRDAVEIQYDNRAPEDRTGAPELETFYLDNEDGSGWRKITEGRGSWRWPHSSLAVERIAEASYD